MLSSASRRYLVAKQGGLLRSSSSLFHQPRVGKGCPSSSVSSYRNGRTVVNSSTSNLYKYYYYSTSTHLLQQQQQQPIRILYASQTGTAQLFAMQLQEEIEELELGDDDMDVSLSAFNEQSPNEVIIMESNGGEEGRQQNPFHIFFSSVTGVGEPPENGKEFYDYIMSKDIDGVKDLDYTVFGLGNEKAHPNNYNVIAKRLDKRLEELGGNRIFPLGLGDDGDCLEDDYDQWLDGLLTFIKTKQTTGGSGSEDTATATAASPVEEQAVEEEPVVAAAAAATTTEQEDPSLRISCSCAISEDGTRKISKKYPTLKLQKNESNAVVCDDLFHLQSTSQQFYHNDTAKLHILKNKILTPNAGEQALNEMTISIKDYYLDNGDYSLDYTTGDHFVVYPRNSHCIVDAYCRVLDVDPHSIVTGQEGGGDAKKYPLPIGLTVYETLSHCVDLGAIPSPSLARQILGRKQLNYKDEIAIPRRTIINLMMETGTRLSLEDILYQMTPMKPRFYSIASSSLANKNEIKITFRPVKYISSCGILREGVATAYLSRKGVVGSSGGDGNGNGSDVHDKNDDYFLRGQVAAYVNSNPTFRLPSDPASPIMMIAGGCGVAPIRAFIAERIALMNQDPTKKFGPGLLYLGFRNPKDAVYRGLIQEAIDCGALSDAKMSFDGGCTEPSQICMRVTDLIRKEGQIVWDHIDKNDGYIYMCGGARTFGAAVEQEMLEIIQEFGNMNFDEAKEYLKRLHADGKLMEDLAD